MPGTDSTGSPDTTTPAAGTATTDSAQDDGRGGKAAILADLARERDNRQALEQQIQQLQTAQQVQRDAFAQALGLKPEETSDVAKVAQQVADLQRLFTESQHENAVLAVANQFGISDQEDLKLLRSVMDADTMRTIAARIGQQPGSPQQSAPGPRPDLSQGPKPNGGAPASPEQDFASFLQKQLSGR